jgi:signal transduction histidine kinase
MNFWLGLALGVLLTIPLIVLFSRRTERRVRMLEHRASDNERLAEQAMLTGGLAHEIKNPLSSVNLNIQLLQEDLAELRKSLAGSPGSDEKVGRIQRRFDSLSRETQRLRTILDDFLRFAGRMKLELAPTDVNAMLGDLVDFFQPQAQSMGVTIRPQLSPGPLMVDADESLLKQAILNLLINACQAMEGARKSNTPHGGASELLVRTQRRILDGGAVEIHITDTGPGISAEDQAKIFQPYFSTKKGGTGLGLPTSRRIVGEHKGTITVHSEAGKGSDFAVTLPGAAAGTPEDRTR